MTALQTYIINSQIEIESTMGSPAFTFNGNTYLCVPSVAEFKHDLDTGGFAQVRLLTATVRLLNADGSSVFTTVPQPQQKIVYSIDGATYRIETVKTDPTRSYFRMIAEFAYKGI